MDKSSNAQQIKKLYKELLSDCEKHSRLELFTYAKKNSGDKFTDGMLTGALRTLVTDTEDYICISRGWYKKKTSEETVQKTNSLVDTYTEILKDALRKSKNIKSDPFQIVKMNQADIQKMKDIEKCINFISVTIDRIHQE